jgi:hypothetical protein
MSVNCAVGALFCREADILTAFVVIKCMMETVGSENSEIAS